jgi:long-chain acyl-CoA synthetase
MISHRNIIANTDSILRYMELTKDDRVMAVLPFHYCYGLSLLHTHLKAAGSVVIETSFMFPEVVLDRMEETGCTGFAGVPSTYQILLGNSSLKKRPFPALRYVQQAGGKLPDALIQELMTALPGKQLFVMYGQTEATARLSYLPPNMLGEKPGSIGKGMPGVTLDVLDEKGEVVKVGETGEIVARGENIGLGYWMNDGNAEGTFRDGILYTGDLARVDEDGYIYECDNLAADKLIIELIAEL